MAPPPPPWLMMAICWPRISENFSAAIRAVTSMPPPGGNGTYILIDRDGKSACAWAAVTQRASAHVAHAAPCSSFLIGLSWGSLGVLLGFSWGSLLFCVAEA